MYFQTEWKEEFYAAGGWTELKLYAKSSLTYLLTELNSLSESQKFDLDIGFHLVKSSNFKYFYIVKTFTRRKKSQDCCFLCSNCFPLFGVLELTRLLLVRQPSHEDIPFVDVRLVEGCMQIVFRTLDEEGFARLYNSYLNNIECDNLEEKTKLANTKAFAAHTEIVHKLIFVEDRSEEIRSDDNLEHCMFCGRNFDKREIPCLKSIIRKTASEVIDSSETDSTTEKKEASSDEQAETEDKKWLRLILALGMEPATSMVIGNLGKEVSGQDSSQNVMDSNDKPVAGEKKMSPKNKREKPS